MTKLPRLVLTAALLAAPAVAAAEDRPGAVPQAPRPTGLETRVEKKLQGTRDSWQRFEPPRPFYRDRSERVWKPTTGDIKLRRAGD